MIVTVVPAVTEVEESENVVATTAGGGGTLATTLPPTLLLILPLYISVRAPVEDPAVMKLTI